MKKNFITTFAKGAKKVFVKKAPAILTGIGVAGGFAATISAVKATPKALRLIEEAEKEKGDKLTPVEVVKTAWKPYLPAAVTTIMSATCIIGASTVSAKRNAALATAYSISETALREYKDKVVEVVGEEKTKEIQDAISKDRITKHPVEKSNVIVTNNSDQLCLDSISNQYFMSTMQKIEDAKNNFNCLLTNYNYASLNEWYDQLGIAESKQIGDTLGWDISRDGLLGLSFSSQISDDGRSCIVIDYNVGPSYDFDRFGR